MKACNLPQLRSAQTFFLYFCIKRRTSFASKGELLHRISWEIDRLVNNVKAYLRDRNSIRIVRKINF